MALDMKKKIFFNGIKNKKKTTISLPPNAEKALIDLGNKFGRTYIEVIYELLEDTLQVQAQQGNIDFPPDHDSSAKKSKRA